jgi:hypothetical protein
MVLILLGKVESRFFQRIMRGAQKNILQPPQSEDMCIHFVRGRKQDVGI